MTQIIGFVGFGNVNSILAQLAVNAGYQVALSNSRGPSTLSDAVAKLGNKASAGTVEEVVRQSDLVSVSVPLKSVEQLPADEFAGKIVIDSMNYYPQRDGHFEELDNRELTTSEWVQSRLKGSQVVKVFNNIDQFHLQYGARPADDATRWALPIAGDSEAKAQVSKFVDAIGFDPVDCGALDESWRFQQNTPVYCTPYIGEWPEGARGDKMLEWVKTDHSKAVKTQDVLELLAQANKLDPVGGVINLPPEYASLFAGVRAMQQQM